jgi:hypothetical protein
MFRWGWKFASLSTFRQVDRIPRYSGSLNSLNRPFYTPQWFIGLFWPTWRHISFACIEADLSRPPTDEWDPLTPQLCPGQPALPPSAADNPWEAHTPSTISSPPALLSFPTGTACLSYSMCQAA